MQVIVAVADEHGKEAGLANAVLLPDLDGLGFEALEEGRQAAGEAAINAQLVDHGVLQVVGLVTMSPPGDPHKPSARGEASPPSTYAGALVRDWSPLARRPILAAGRTAGPRLATRLAPSGMHPLHCVG